MSQFNSQAVAGLGFDVDHNTQEAINIADQSKAIQDMVLASNIRFNQAAQCQEPDSRFEQTVEFLPSAVSHL